ncbi:ATP-binding protein [Streptomyces sp. 150FB]|uniref:sensor histidine kinase n=1 Tax=Streptomyces sp. 150FB TaxID=1576605 RepID=UPI00099CE1A6|nr:ATP-binding protein [Streptomyces sp. 150FB]
MSQLRAPAARPERREGGRHGRPGNRSLLSAGRQQTPKPAARPSGGSPAGANAPSPPDARIRPQLLRAAVLPAIVATLSGAAAVVLTLRSGGAEPTPGIWAGLTAMALLALAAIGVAALGADRAARSLTDRCIELRRSNARRQAELNALVGQLRRGEKVPARPTPSVPSTGGDELDLLARELSRSHEDAAAAVIQASRLSSSAGNEQKVEVFVNLARRLQSLVHREIQLLDELENEVEDPELLKGLFHVDHLATRIRRHAENLAVLGGAHSRRQWSKPVHMTEVLRSAIAEVEQYPRIKLVPPMDGTLRGHAVADVIHLLAELVENATLFSSPHTTVLLRAQRVTAGLAIEVEDRGLGMPAEEQKRMNALLTDPDQVNVAHLLQDGRIGLFVVAALARRHGIAVRLQSNIYGGVQAVLVLPESLLGAEQGTGNGNRPMSVPTGHPAGTTEPGTGRPQDQTYAHDQARAHAQAHAHARDQAQDQAQEQALMHAQAYGTHLPHGAPAPGPVPGPDGSTPLPVRGRHSGRPTPAEARPGFTHRTPPGTATGNETGPAEEVVPEARADGLAESATGERPQLPKRRGQEHLVPQLRDAPAAPSTEEPVLHDPGLMAAFRRGIGLAESEPEREREREPESRPEPGSDPSGRPLPEQPQAAHVPHRPARPDPLDPRDMPEPQSHDTTLKE